MAVVGKCRVCGKVSTLEGIVPEGECEECSMLGEVSCLERELGQLRERNLALKNICHAIVDEAKFSSDGRTGRVTDDLIDRLESLLE